MTDRAAVLPFVLSGTGGRLALLGWTLLFQAAALGLLAQSKLLALLPAGIGGRLILFGLFGLTLAAWLAAVVRRLHEMGRSGWYVLLFLVPLVGLGLLLWLLFAAPRPVDPDRFAPGPRYVLGGGVLVVIVLLFASRALWVPHRMVSEHMAPTFDVGAIFLSMDLRLGAVTPGDVITYSEPLDDGGERIHVARAIAFAGQTVEMRDGHPVIDGAVADHTAGVCGPSPCIHEMLPTGAKFDIFDDGPSPRDDMPAMTVPEGAVFVLGDNRDHATDSRVSPAEGGPGVVAMASVRGRVFSLWGGRE